MIEDATYGGSGRRVRMRVDRTDVWQESTDEILNFPLLVELADNQLYLGVRRRQHGTTHEEPAYFLLSEDEGQAWEPAPRGMDFGNGGMQTFVIDGMHDWDEDSEELCGIGP